VSWFRTFDRKRAIDNNSTEYEYHQPRNGESHAEHSDNYEEGQHPCECCCHGAESAQALTAPHY
jgi:hypothetical protein